MFVLYLENSILTTKYHYFFFSLDNFARCGNNLYLSSNFRLEKDFLRKLTTFSKLYLYQYKNKDKTVMKLERQPWHGVSVEIDWTGVCIFDWALRLYLCVCVDSVRYLITTDSVTTTLSGWQIKLGDTVQHKITAIVCVFANLLP